MSLVESEAKAPLQRALESNITTLSTQDAERLAVWAVLKVIVGEHAAEHPLTPAEDRAAFRTSRALPPYFQVFLSKHQSNARAAYLRHSATLSLTMDGPIPRLSKGVTRNVQVVTLIVGPLCFYITAVRVNDIDLSMLNPRRAMHRIYPRPTSDIDLESILPLTDIDMHINSQAIDRVLAHPKVKYGGDVPPDQ